MDWLAASRRTKTQDEKELEGIWWQRELEGKCVGQVDGVVGR